MNNYFNLLNSIYDKINKQNIDIFIQNLYKNINKGHIYCIGNGGSAANVSHNMIDFNKIDLNGLKFKFISLCDSNASITAIGNDDGFENIFVNQLKNFLEEDDILFAVSVSGSSPNIIKAVKYAKEKNNKIYSITRSNSILSNLSDYTIEIPIFNYEIVEDFHHIIMHFIKKYIQHIHLVKSAEKNFFNDDLVFIKNLNGNVGFTCGTFDLTHAGHILMFEDCKTVCDYLIVGLHIDPSAERKEKNKPIQSIEERKVLLNSIKYIDHIIEYNTEKDLLILLEKIKPDIRIIGSDWKYKEYTGMDLDLEIYWHDRNHNLSSSNIRNRVLTK